MATLEATAMSTPAAGAPSPDDLASAQRFRFASTPAISDERQEILAQWHRTFLKAVTGTLGDLLRVKLELSMDDIKLLAYSELITERGTENRSLHFRMEPQSGTWMLDLPEALALFSAERMMGGAEEFSDASSRELTEVEELVFEQFAETFLADYALGWRPHADLKAEILRQVNQLRPEGSFGFQREDMFLRVNVQIKLNDATSHFWIVIPMSSVEDLLSRLGSDDESPALEAPVNMKDKNSPMGSVLVPVSIRWQGFQITLREVDAMVPGDILVLDNKKCEHAVIWLADRAKFSGRVQREPQKTVITITHPLE